MMGFSCTEYSYYDYDDDDAAAAATGRADEDRIRVFCHGLTDDVGGWSP